MTLVAVAGVLTPTTLINPASPQTPGGLRTAHLLRQVVPTLNVALFVAGVALALWLWRTGVDRRGRLGLVFATVLLGSSALAGRVDPARLMFRPLDTAGFVSASRAEHVEPADLVLGLTVGGEAAAYPVPIVAYHHIVNDRLAGEPFVVTY